MKTKLIGVFVGMLLIAITVPAVESLKHSAFNSTVPDTPHTSMAANWTEMQKLLASDGENNDSFGISVSLDSDTALIGAWGDSDHGNYSGSVYVFTRTGTIWTQQAKLLASDGVAYDCFGVSVSLDGDTALIGAWADSDNGYNSGSAYVFTRTGTNWTQQAKLLASDGQAGDTFGCAVSLDGDTALIGAYCDDDNGNDSGSAYVFTCSSNTWTQQQKLHASDSATEDYFGCSVSLDGNTALIGAWGNRDSGPGSGSAYVFSRTGTSWTQQQKLLASDGATADFFGCSVSLDGNIALIGAIGDDNLKGSAYVFINTGGTWIQQAKLLASDGVAMNTFGGSVSLDGNTALIGADGDDDNGNYSGSAYVFTRTGTIWTQQAKLLPSDGAAEDHFSWSSIAVDGDTALIGAWGDSDNGFQSGSAYIFTGPHQPPTPPTIDGPAWGLINVNYTFCITVTDPYGDNIYIIWDWGDGNTTGWLGPYSSGQMFCVTYAWSQKGTYGIRVKFKDASGVESEWSDPHFIHIYELKRAVIFFRFDNIINMTTQENFTFVHVQKICIILFQPFQFHHYVTEKNITYAEDMRWGIISHRFLIAGVDLVNNLNDQSIARDWFRS